MVTTSTNIRTFTCKNPALQINTSPVVLHYFLTLNPKRPKTREPHILQPSRYIPRSNRKAITGNS